MNDVAIIGGGASGMMAAIFAARAGAKVILLERNEKLGKKIYITGKGRCNVTNSADRDTLMASIMRNPRFCYAALANLDNAALMRFFEENGVPLKEERGGRIFPVSDHASDITRCLDLQMARLGVRVLLNTRVRELAVDSDGSCAGVVTEEGDLIAARAVIVATGGMSYPSTGSTGDGYRIAEETGHKVKKPLPSLVPIHTREDWPFGLSGLSLKNVGLSCRDKKGKKIFDMQGELLLTHTGISGPLALTLSATLPEDCADLKMAIDLKPALDEATLEKRLLRETAEHPRQMMGSVMDALEPHALGLCVLSLASVPAETRAASLTQAMRRNLVQTLKAMPLTVMERAGFNEAVITRGGVATSDIDPSTMASKRMKGLYFAGETIDIDALTGGFNLQLAFSTGALAGQSAAAFALEKG